MNRPKKGDKFVITLKSRFLYYYGDYEFDVLPYTHLESEIQDEIVTFFTSEKDFKDYVVDDYILEYPGTTNVSLYIDGEDLIVVVKVTVQDDINEDIDSYINGIAPGFWKIAMGGGMINPDKYPNIQNNTDPEKYVVDYGVIKTDYYPKISKPEWTWIDNDIFPNL